MQNVAEPGGGKTSPHPPGPITASHLSLLPLLSSPFPSRRLLSSSEFHSAAPSVCSAATSFLVHFMLCYFLALKLPLSVPLWHIRSLATLVGTPCSAPHTELSLSSNFWHTFFILAVAVFCACWVRDCSFSEVHHVLLLSFLKRF